MRTEKEKMISGAAYCASDPELVAERQHARTLCQQLNTFPPSAPVEGRHTLLAKLFGAESDVCVTAPFFCDYGYNVKLGANVYFNFNCIVLDVMPVSIGNNVLFGPAVQIYTALHPMNSTQRRTGLEYGKSVVIEDDVWIGGGSIICPGVTIGTGSVIGAGSVVTRDIKANVFAAGNPCRFIREL